MLLGHELGRNYALKNTAIHARNGRLIPLNIAGALLYRYYYTMLSHFGQMGVATSPRQEHVTAAGLTAFVAADIVRVDEERRYSLPLAQLCPQCLCKNIIYLYAQRSLSAFIPP